MLLLFQIFSLINIIASCYPFCCLISWKFFPAEDTWFGFYSFKSKSQPNWMLENIWKLIGSKNMWKSQNRINVREKYQYTKAFLYNKQNYGGFSNRITIVFYHAEIIISEKKTNERSENRWRSPEQLIQKNREQHKTNEC